MVRKKIITNNTEIYNEFSNLKLTSTSKVILKTAKVSQMNKIVNDINKNGKTLDMEISDNEILITKLIPVNFDIYLAKKIKKII